MTTNLQTLAETKMLHVFDSRMAAVEHNYRATLTPEQLRGYRIYSGEIVAECPACHAKDAEVTHDGGPDMVGCWWSTTCDACGQVVDSGADGLEAVR